jgi:tetratricopeptide (TPR) repeat protein
MIIPSRYPKIQFLLFLILGLLVAAIYANTLGGPFVFDDGPNIKHNPHIARTTFSLDDLSKTAFESPSSNRPVANISFGLNYYFGGYHVLGWHLVNIAIHMITGLLLYLLVKTTLLLSWKTGRDESILGFQTAGPEPVQRWRSPDPSWVSFWAAALWLVHPVQTQSVTYIVQRMNSMAAMFCVLSLLLYARARVSQTLRINRSRHPSTHPYVLFAGSLLGALLAFGSKETAATLPVLILLYELYFFQDFSWAWVTRNYLYVGIVLVLFGITAAVYLGNHPWDTILDGYARRDFTPGQRVLTEFRVVIFYLSLLIWPHPSRLNLEHDFALSHSLFVPATTGMSLGLIIGLLALAIYLAPRQRIFSFCLLWFLGNLVIESSVIGLELVFEHRLYLPSMFLSLAAVMVFCRYVKFRWLQTVLLGVVVMVCAFWTFERNTVWSDEVTLLRDCILKSPQKARPHYNLGIALAEIGQADEAIEHYRQALRINPGYASAHTNLGIELYRRGKVDEAFDHYAKALKINPDFENAHMQLGIALAGIGRIPEAIDHYAAILRINPASSEAHNNLGNIFLKQGRMEAATRHYSRAIKINPNYAAAYNNMGAAMIQLGRLNRAIVLFKEAVRIDPAFSDARNNLESASKAKRPGAPSSPGIAKK